MRKDESTKYFEEEYQPKYGREVVQVLRKRGLNRGVALDDKQKVDEYTEQFNEALNDSAVQINAGQRGKTNTEMLHMSLERKIRRDAHTRGLNTTLIEKDESK